MAGYATVTGYLSPSESTRLVFPTETRLENTTLAADAGTAPCMRGIRRPGARVIRESGVPRM